MGNGVWVRHYDLNIEIFFLQEAKLPVAKVERKTVEAKELKTFLRKRYEKSSFLINFVKDVVLSLQVSKGL